MNTPPPSGRVTVLAATGAGKSVHLRNYWWPRARRLLVCDHIGEYSAQLGAVGFDQTLALLREHAHLPNWRLFAGLVPEEIEELSRVLLPFPDLQQSPALKLGGMAISIDEVDRVIGFGAGAGMRDLWRRGRHVGLTVFGASQRPANVSKEITSMSEAIVMLHVHEPSDVDYMRDLMGRERLATAMQWISGAQFRFAMYFPHTMRLGLYEPTPLLK